MDVPVESFYTSALTTAESLQRLGVECAVVGKQGASSALESCNIVIRARGSAREQGQFEL